MEQERSFLAELAQARLDGEIDDDVLAQQLRDEQRTFEDTLLVCSVLSKKLAQDAANAAIDALNTAIKAALTSVIGAGRGKGKSVGKKASSPKLAGRRLNARPDTTDFRDLMYVPTLVEVGTTLPLSEYRKVGVPILDQGNEGACTGYGLATVVHYLLRSRRRKSDKKQISPRMLYEMARRYDEWPGEAYEGSSCRGAMKGWHKHGICSLSLWSHNPRQPDNTLSDKRVVDARQRPLGAYFRVNHKDLVSMHAALSEVGVLYASCSVHSGWDAVKKDGIIPFDSNVTMEGGHAFAIVAYDREGFWIQNSWGAGWGMSGFCRISYEDWLKNGSDVWVARLGVPVSQIDGMNTVGNAFSVSARARAIAYEDVRPHVISLGNDGQLKSTGPIGTTPSLVRQIIHSDFAQTTKNWKKRRLVLYAHGGLVDEDGAVQRVAEYRVAMLQAECYPLAFIWHSDYWSTLKDILADALRRRRPEGAIGDAKDFLLDRLDDALEPLARVASGKAQWDEMKENALAATLSPTGGARLVLNEIAAFVGAGNPIEIHIVGHSAGSIFHAPLVRYLASPAPDGLGLPIESCTLWAPACTMALFEEYFAPLMQNGINRFALYTLTDEAERNDNCAHIYNKSLLYLVSDAFEKRPRIPIFRPDGEPILGMEKFVLKSAVLGKLLKNPGNAWVKAPNNIVVGDIDASGSMSHGGFDDDEATVKGTLARILKLPAKAALQAQAIDFKTGRSHLQDCRQRLDAVRR
ncbi:MAG: C1 family peptidase [Steroidobacteraceae bacterium]